MKKFIMMLALFATTAFAEPSFNQVQDLIGQHQYAAAEAGLVEIIKNHPQSAKAYYSMAQAQAGLGNLDKARYALDKATGLDPTLSFASQSQVKALRDAVTPQVAKIEQVEEGHFLRNLVLVLMFAGFIYALYRLYKVYNGKKDEGFGLGGTYTPTPSLPPSSGAKIGSTLNTTTAKSDSGKSVYSTPIYSSSSPSYSAPAPVAHTTVVNNSSNDGLLTGVILGNMMSSHHDHHDRIIEREVVREVPSKSYESSSRRSSSSDSDSSSNSWDSDSSSSRDSSSSWSSSSSRDSSWDSGSSSSSSWDSGSSSSDSSW